MQIARTLLLLWFFVALARPTLAQSETITPENADQLVETARLGRGWVGGVSWSPDGDAVFAASMTGVYRYGLDGSETQALPFSGTDITQNYVFNRDYGVFEIYSLATGEMIDIHPIVCNQPLAWLSPDESLLAVSDCLSIQLWSLRDRKLLTSIPVESDPKRGTLAFSPDNRLFAAAFEITQENSAPGEPLYIQEVRVWSVDSGEHITTLTTNGLDRVITSVRFSADNRRVLTSRIGGVTVYEVESGDFERHDLPNLPAGSVYGDYRTLDWAVWVNDETRIVSAWSDQTPGQGMPSFITVWDAQTGEIVSEVGGWHGFLSGPYPSPDGSLIAAYSYEGLIFVWDTENEPQIITDQHPAGAELLAAHGDILAVGGFDRAVRLWSLSTHELTETIFAHASEVQAIAFSARGLFASASVYDTWVRNSDSRIQDINLDAGDMLALGFNDETLSGVTGWGGENLTVWTNAQNGLQTSPLNVSSTRAAIGYEEAAVVIAGGMTDDVYLFDLQGNQIGDFNPGSTVTSLQYTPNGQLLVGISGAFGIGGHLSLWSTGSDPERSWGVPLHTQITTAAFSPDGDLIVLSLVDGTLEVRAAEDGTLLASYPDQGVLFDVIFSPDGTQIIGAVHTQVVIWSVGA